MSLNLFGNSDTKTLKTECLKAKIPPSGGIFALKSVVVSFENLVGRRLVGDLVDLLKVLMDVVHLFAVQMIVRFEELQHLRDLSFLLFHLILKFFAQLEIV